MYKAKQRLSTLLVACLTFVVSILLALTLWVPTAKIQASAAETTKEISVLGTTGTLSSDSASISWTNDNVVFTNYKAGSSTAIRTSDSAHYRVYANSEIEVSAPGNITQIVITSAGSSYYTPWVESAGTVGTATLNGSEITLVPTTPAAAIKFAATEQVRLSKVVVTYETGSSDPAPDECEHTNTTTTTVDANCTEEGSTTVTCDDCGETVSETTIAALGHNYVDGVCSTCGEEEPSLKTVDVAIAGSTGTLASDSSSISWSNGNIDVVNTKGSTAIRTSDTDHFRAYANSVTTISTKDRAAITNIAITCLSGYTDELTGATYSSTVTESVNDLVVVLTMKEVVSEFSITLTAQCRLNKITVTYEACEHTNTITETVDPTCTEDGTEKVTCTDCGYIVETPITALGHKYNGVVTPPTETEEGFTTYTCSVCGDTYQDDFVPAVGTTTYTVYFHTPKNVADIPSEEIAKDFPITLPKANAAEGFTFIGWTREEYDANTAIPEFYAADYEYTVTGNTNFYALYSWGTISWNLVTDESSLTAGKEIVIVASESNNALSTTQNSNNRAQTSITKSADKTTVEVGDAVQIITLEAGTVSDTFAFNVGDGYLYAASSGSNYLRTQTTNDENSSWNITIADGIATIKAQGTNTRNWLRHNPSNSIFSCYASGQKDVSIYMKSGVIYYATTPAKITSASVTIKEDLALNYYVEIPNEIAESASVSYTICGETYSNASLVEDGERYKFSLDLPPQYMSENIVVEIYHNDTAIAIMEKYSIQQYAIDQLNDTESSTELKQLVSDMLHYGAAAQEYKDYNTTNLANDENSVENILPPSSDAIPEEKNIFKVENNTLPEGTKYNAWFTGANVWFDNYNKLIVTINTTENVTVKINDEEPIAVTSTTIEIPNLLPTDFATKYTFELYYDNVLMQTLTYSVNAYAYKMCANETASTEMKALALALYNYGASAAAYTN